MNVLERESVEYFSNEKKSLGPPYIYKTLILYLHLNLDVICKF